MTVKISFNSDKPDKLYESATRIESNGFGDYVFKDDAGRVVATRKRTEDIEDVELI